MTCIKDVGIKGVGFKDIGIKEVGFNDVINKDVGIKGVSHRRRYYKAWLLKTSV